MYLFTILKKCLRCNLWVWFRSNYALNNPGSIYKVNISGSGALSDTGDDGATTSNNDGAAYHAGDPTITFNPSVTATQEVVMGQIVK